MLPKILRFIIDAQLPPSLADFFKRRGLDATHVVDYPLGAMMQDIDIISIAISEERIAVTKDIDFFDYYMLKNHSPSVLLLQLGNIKNRDLFDFMEINLDRIKMLFTEETRRLVLINRHKIIIY
jgi:predicted nuclease of predicted toxin-antitoxin system